MGFKSTEEIIRSASAESAESVSCTDCGQVYAPITLPLTGATVPYRMLATADGPVCVDCWSIRWKAREVRELLDSSGLPDEYKKLEASLFPSDRLAMLRLWWAERRPLWVYGPRKAGKSWLMAFLCKSLCLAGKRAIWRDWEILKRAATSTYSDDTEFSDFGLLEELLRAETLFVDDLALEDMTPSRLSLLKGLFNAQDQHRLLIIVTSNVSLLTFSQGIKDDRIGTRLDRFRWARTGIESPVQLKGSYTRTGMSLRAWENPGEPPF